MPQGYYWAPNLHSQNSFGSIHVYVPSTFPQRSNSNIVRIAMNSALYPIFDNGCASERTKE